ncbi:CE1759 family FMN reductase [Gulosibacter hominis]|uniref:CE1759 family FMN reductase n=1 Tax=Gulosibacter hominis TaxID=2770504 RepID=UPI00191A2E39|nr:CE1759 family FMN reductase [Gulosibacter hominis]
MSNELRLAVVSAGTSDPSTTRMLADRLVAAANKFAQTTGVTLRVDVIETRELNSELADAMTSQFFGPKLEHAVEVLREADGLVAVSPVYKAAPSASFTALFQVLDQDLLIGKPVLLAATAGTPRHSLVVDNGMRASFAYLRALVTPTGVFATTEDWSSPELADRIERAAYELWLLMRSGFARSVREDTWHSYQHQFGSDGGNEFAVDFESDLMKLATGGTLPPEQPQR